MNLDEPKKTGSILDFVPEAGELGNLIATHNWSDTSLGPIEAWPQSLRTCVHIMLSSRQPIWIGWGQNLIKLYNDPYKSILGGKHPRAVGEPASVVWKDIWNDIEPMLRQVMENGIGTYVESQLLIMERNGYPEETYYTFSYTPVPGDDGEIAGMFCANTDDTERIINERQLKTLTKLGTRLVDCKSTHDVITRSIATLEENAYDFPFAIFRIREDENLTFAHSTPLGASKQFIQDFYKFTDISSPVNAALKAAVEQRKINLFDQPAELAGKMPSGAWARPSEKAIAVPIIPTGMKDPFGVLTIGLNPYRLFDEKYESFFQLVADQIATSLADVNALEEERRRAEALAEIDRAKTTFFSNISHELRTPLTLMLAPIEDSLQDAEISGENRRRLDIAHRNARRLLKLVNTLLDFSRIEAGRMNAKFQPVNLSEYTHDLASTFRAAIEKAGMALEVETEDDVNGYVDTDMWEKIVLNLLSNAFKYTQQGTIKISLNRKGNLLELSVQDTGIGIAQAELGKIFERFHRVQNTAGRSQEGTGIGLALVQELVKIHGGEISVKSNLNHGSTFTVIIPAGKDHLPQEMVAPKQNVDYRKLANAGIYVDEMMNLLPAGPAASDETVAELHPDDSKIFVSQGQSRNKILLADDNADMRAYLTRLLSSTYEVTAVNNGQLALEALETIQPDIILSDVMMPEVDGFELVNKIKSRADTKHIPVVLLSARAGEEATIEGLSTGADDYLVKPFSARELLSRLNSTLKIAQSRTNSIKQVYNLFMSAPVAIAVLTGDELRFEMANGQYLELAGKTSVNGKTLEEAFPELKGSGIKEMLEGVYRNNEPFYGNEFEVDLVRGGRTEHLYLNFTYTPLKGPDNTTTGVMVIAIDVTDMVLGRRKTEAVVAKRTEELMKANMELKLSEERYHRMVDEVEDYAIILLDRNGTVQNWNRGAEKIKGYKESEIVGQSFETFYLQEDRERGLPRRLLQEAVVHGKASIEGWRVRKNGKKFWSSVLMTALHNDAGEIIGFSKVTRDLTERKLAEDRLHEYSNNLEEQNRELEQFAYAASHDMKEPLRKIYFSGTSLQERTAGQIDQKSADYLSRILSSTQKMTNLVDNLLNYSKTTANIESATKVNLNTVVREITSGISETMENQHVHFEIDVLPEIIGVPFQCAQLFDNLIHNSLKYRHPDRPCEIQIRYEQTEEAFDLGKCHKISVIDNGIGFEQQFSDKIFEIFKRLGTDKNGDGIGLAICKRIVQNHQGAIKAFGNPGVGARFDVYFPFIRIG